MSILRFDAIRSKIKSETETFQCPYVSFVRNFHLI